MKVKIPTSGTYKCVLLKSDFGRGEDVKFRSCDGNFHSEVFRNSKDEEPDLNSYSCVGGGRMTISDKKLTVWGYSVDYGEMDKSVVESMLSEYCQENNLEFVNRSGQGY